MPSRRFGAVDLLLYLLILAGAAGARLAYLGEVEIPEGGPPPLRVQDTPSSLPRPAEAEGETVRPATELEQLVTNLKESGRFASRAPFASEEELTAHTSPGYPWLLSLLRYLSADLPSVDETVRWLQVALGTLTVGLYFLFARRAFDSLLVGTLAGVFCALHPYWVVNAAEINDGTLAAFLLAAALFAGQVGSQNGGAFTSLIYGLALAALALVRAAYLPFAFVAMIWFLYRCRTLPRGWLYAVLAALGFLNGLAPWTIRNVQTFHDVVPIVDSTYLHLWMGNNPFSTGGPQNEQTMLVALARAEGEDPSRLSERLAGLPQNERYQQFARPVLAEAQNDPAGTLKRRLDAGLRFFVGEQWFRTGAAWQGTTDGIGLPSWLDVSLPALFNGALLGMLLLAVLGWRWSYCWRRQAMPLSLAVFWIPLPYLLSHAEELHGPRLPLDGVLLCYAAFALACVVPTASAWLREGRGANGK